MTATVAMYEKSLEVIGARLAALDLDIRVIPFDRDGMFRVDGVPTPPGELDVDYLWLSTHLNADGTTAAAFELALACRSLKVLQTFNAGLDDPFHRAAADRGIRICNSSAQGVAIAEYVLAQVLSILHPIELQRRQQRDRIWKVTPFREIAQTRWLTVGFGAIGSELATRVKAFGATTTVVRRRTVVPDTVDRTGVPGDLPVLLPEADIIVLACALNDETAGMVDASFLAAVRPGAILVNIARGGLIHDDALIAALDDGRLEAAVLDVFHEEPLPRDNPLWSHPRVRLTPHTSFAGKWGTGTLAAAVSRQHCPLRPRRAPGPGSRSGRHLISPLRACAPRQFRFGTGDPHAPLGNDRLLRQLPDRRRRREGAEQAGRPRMLRHGHQRPGSEAWCTRSWARSPAGTIRPETASGGGAAYPPSTTGSNSTRRLIPTVRSGPASPTAMKPTAIRETRSAARSTPSVALTSSGRFNHVTAGHVRLAAIAQLREPAQKIADRIQALMNSPTTDAVAT